MSARRALEGLLSKTLRDEDGELIRPRLIPPDPRDTWAAVRARIHTPIRGTPLAPEIEDLLRLGAGVEIGHVEIRWDGNLSGQYLDEAFPCVYPVMDDGFGNSWAVEVDARTGAWGPVYFICHDPPVVVFQAESFGAFLEQAVTVFDADGPFNCVHDDAAMHIWRTGGRMTPVEQARTDPVLARAAAGAPPGSWIADLRGPRTGDGFAWGKFGPDTRLARPLADPIFVVSPPE